MGLPWRTFTESVTWMQLITASKATSAELGQFYNIAYREVVESYQWAARKAEAVVNTVDPYTTGTVSITQGSTTVTGTGTTFTSSMVNRYIRAADEDVFYKITVFTDATHVTIEKAWPYATITDEDYEIFQYLYAVDNSAGEVGVILMPHEGVPMVEKSLYWINNADPARRQSGSLPSVYILHGVDSSHAHTIEFWPRYTSATSVRIPYYKRVDDLSGSDKPIVQSNVVESLALMYAFSMLYTKFGAPEYLEQRNHYGAVFEIVLEKALQVDFDRHNTPRAVQDQTRMQRDWDYTTRHDV